MNLSVDVISDVICPWCYIGKRRLETAIAAGEGQQAVRVRWLPFQLNPTMPKEGTSRREYRIIKLGSWERSLELEAKLVAVGETEGIPFAFDRIERTPNTVDAHRLIWLADQQGCQDAIVEALFRAYLQQGLRVISAFVVFVGRESEFERCRRSLMVHLTKKRRGESPGADGIRFSL
jgi:predicted DsbA family dithiol-disulfide isomerase